MEKTDPEDCVLCGHAAVDAPRIHVRQELELEAPVPHHLALCAEHGAALCSGATTPLQIIYAWATRAHAELYRNERLVLRPEPTCLACDAALTAPAESAECEVEAGCPACGATNVLGRALGQRIAVRMRALSN